MKKLILVISLMLLIMTFLTESKAACPPWGDFIPGGFARIQLSSTCYMEVEFCYRIWTYGEDIDYDLWMGEIKFVGDCDFFRFDFENNPSNYFQRAWEYIAFVENPWEAEFPPVCPTPSNEYWRLGHASCYSNGWEVHWVPADPANGELGHFEWIKRPCNIIDESHYCWRLFTVCLYYDAACNCMKPRITPVGEGYGSAECGEECNYICE